MYNPPFFVIITQVLSLMDNKYVSLFYFYIQIFRRRPHRPVREREEGEFYLRGEENFEMQENVELGEIGSPV